MNDLFFGLCGLPVKQDVLKRLLDRSGDERPGPEIDPLSADPVFWARATLAASAMTFRGSGPLAFTLESVARRLGEPGLIALAAHAAVRQQQAGSQARGNQALRELRAQGSVRARIALELALRAGYERPDEARFAALLLDLGRITLLALADAPESFDGTGDDAELGAQLLASWGFGPLICDAIRYQGEPPDRLADAHPLARILGAARLLCEAGPSGLQGACADAATLMDLDPVDLRGLVERQSGAASESDPPAGSSRADADEADDTTAALVSHRALLGEMRAYWSAADNEWELLVAAAQVLTLFFGVRQVLYLQRDGDRLKGVDLFGTGFGADEILIRLQNTGSLIARAAAGARFLHTLDATPSALAVIDRQAIGVLACGGMLCVPLAADGAQPGIFLAGLHPCRRDWMDHHRTLLHGFVTEAGHALAILRRHQAQDSWTRQESRSDCNLRARRAAHEVSTPLAVIGNYVSVIQMKLAQGQPVEADLAVIADELARSERIIRELSEGLRDRADARELALNALVRDLAALIRETLVRDRGISLTQSLDDRVPATLDLDAHAVRQILINLARNALEAMEDGGELHLSTEDRLRFEDGDYVAVSVSDKGPGLPAQVLACLYEPVKSAKGMEHQGLGLSIVKDLADRMGARLICRSREGVGTTFTVLLPRRAMGSATGSHPAETDAVP